MMKFKQTQITVFSALVITYLILPIVSLASSSEISYKVPERWLSSATNNSPYRFQSPSLSSVAGTSANSNPAFAQGTQHIMKTNLKGIEKYQAGPSNEWKLQLISFDLGIGLGGNLGVLILKGTPAFQLYWVPKSSIPVTPPPKTNPNPSPMALMDTSSIALVDEEQGGLTLSNTEALDRQVKVVTKAIYSTGKVQRTPTLERDLKRTAVRFFSLMDKSNTASAQNWKLGRMRMDLMVMGNGMIHAGLTVGGALRLRLQWVPDGKRTVIKDPVVDPILDPALEKVSDGMHQVISGFLTALDFWTIHRPFVAYQPKLIRIGLGVNTGFNVGVVRGGAGAVFHAQFVPNPQPKNPAANKPVWMAANTTSLNSVMKTTNRIPLDIPLYGDDNAEVWSELFELEHPTGYRFQSFGKEIATQLKVSQHQINEGMNKAADMARFFIDQGKAASKDSSWELYRIKTNLDLALGGNTSVATVTGLVSLEVAFQK